MPKLFDPYAAFYDLEFGSKCDDIPFILEYARNQGPAVLELGCGTGRILIPVAQAGIPITGIDISPNMLEVAKQKVKQLPLDIQGNIELVRMGIERFRLNKEFSLIICVFNTFMRVRSSAAKLGVLRRVYEHLRSGGLFINEVFIPSNVSKDRVYTTEFSIDSSTRLVKRERLCYDANRQLILVENRYRVIRPDEEKNYKCSFILHYVSAVEIKDMFEEAGLQILDTYGGYDRTPFEGKRMILVARKPA